MRTVNLGYAKAHLSRLVREAAAGEPFVIARAGKPLVQVVALNEANPYGFLDRGLRGGRARTRGALDEASPFGFLDGEIEVPEDFDTMYANEIRAMFEGEHEGVPEPE